MNHKYKDLIKNIGVFSMASFATKLLNFLILPLYTGFLSTYEYGIIDLIHTAMQLLFPLFSLTIAEAVLRFAIDEPVHKDTIFTIAVKIIVIGVLPLLALAAIVAATTNDFYVPVIFIILYILQSFFTLFGVYAKADNKVKHMALISTSTSFVILILNVLFIAGLELGLEGYFVANILGYLFGDVCYILVCKLYDHFSFRIHLSGNSYVKEMLGYSVPLIPNAVFWWINSGLDRLTITIISGVSYVGIYAAAYKIPTILSTVTSVFSQAWNLSMFQSKKGTERAELFGNVYHHFCDTMFCLSLILITLTRVIGKIFLLNDFYSACVYIPLLAMGMFYNALNVFIGSAFTSNKDTKYIFSTTAKGALINCILNFGLVYIWGPIGAALATAVSYFTVFVMRTIKIKKIYSMDIDFFEAAVQFVLLVIAVVLASYNILWWVVMILAIGYSAYYIKTMDIIKLIKRKH